MNTVVGIRCNVFNISMTISFCFVIYRVFICNDIISTKPKKLIRFFYGFTLEKPILVFSQGFSFPRISQSYN